MSLLQRILGKDKWWKYWYPVRKRLTRYHIWAFRDNIFLGFRLFQWMNNQDEKKFAVGIEYTVKDRYKKDSLSGYTKYIRKRRYITIRFIIGWLQFGDFGKRQEDVKKDE